MPCCAPPLTPCHTAQQVCRPAPHQTLKPLLQALKALRIDPCLYAEAGHSNASAMSPLSLSFTFHRPHQVQWMPQDKANKARGRSFMSFSNTKLPSLLTCQSPGGACKQASWEGYLDNDVCLIEGLIVKGTPQDLLGASRVARLCIQRCPTVVRPAQTTNNSAFCFWEFSSGARTRGLYARRGSSRAWHAHQALCGTISV